MATDDKSLMMELEEGLQNINSSVMELEEGLQSANSSVILKLVLRLPAVSEPVLRLCLASELALKLQTSFRAKLEDLAPPQKNLGWPQKNLGSPQKNLGWPQKNLGSPQKNLGWPQENLGSPQENLGWPQENLGSPQENLGSPKENLGAQKGAPGKPGVALELARVHFFKPKDLALQPREVQNCCASHSQSFTCMPHPPQRERPKLHGRR